MESGLPTPPIEKKMKMSISTTAPRRNTSSSTKSVKPIHRGTKRSASHLTHSPVHDHAPLSPLGMDSRHKRVWKACERCRMKKTKCDGEFPCKRCKDDGLVCTAGTRKKTEYKQLPRGYAEVLENTQFALIATVHKLYSMVRSGQQWDLGEPGLNDKGQPVIHDIATKLGCMRPSADADLPPHSVFPEDEAGLAKLAAELEAQQKERDALAPEHKSETESSCTRTDRASSSELDHSDFEQDYRKAMLSDRHQNLQTLSPQSFTSSYHEFEPSPTMQTDVDPSRGLFAVQSPSAPTAFPTWNMNRPAAMDNLPASYMLQMDINMAEIMLSQGLVESEFGTIKPHMINVPNPEVMLGVGDPMIYSGYPNMESLRS
ncbi:Uu.00g111710.m01.CDS01 [Anthostomella pinea]|uniref:Uu.00g111710.m01.CDS01 n=1 Tax=Anthostomella pinea TaxID=933095 RepID=A0AAI8YDZ3_9PEZI|nr:Uu.00g111710.m01.CDS01 [Anthostomella pinea]